MATKAYHFLLLGDFSPQKPLVREFIQLLNYFSFTQFISGPTHIQDNILDLVMSLGFPITNIEVRDAGLSDHLPIIFDCSITVLKSESRPSTYLSRVINSSTAVQFTKVIAELSAGVTAQFSYVDGLVDSFNTSCTGNFKLV